MTLMLHSHILIILFDPLPNRSILPYTDHFGKSKIPEIEIIKDISRLLPDEENLVIEQSVVELKRKLGSAKINSVEENSGESKRLYPFLEIPRHLIG